MPRIAVIAWLSILALGVTGGCADLDRQLFENNRRFARSILQPMAKHYKRTVPEPLRKGLRNVTSNVAYTDVMVNNLLQGKPIRAVTDLGRIAANTVMGFGGIMDPATDIGIPRYDEDFGQTLGVWGFEPGPYFNMPFIGPTTLRDVWQYPFKVGTSPFTYVDARYVSLPLGVANYFFERFDDVGKFEMVEEAADPYEFVRTAYLQNRESLVYDGNPPTRIDEGLDEELDEALEGLEDDDLEGLDELEGLDDLEAPERIADPEALEGLDDVDDLESLEDGVVPAGALPPPQVIRRAGPAPPAPPAPSAPAAPVATRPGVLPPPAVHRHEAARP